MISSTHHLLRFAIVAATFLTVAMSTVSLHAADRVSRVEYRDELDDTQTAEGRVMGEAEDGGLMLQSADGTILVLPATQVIKQTETEAEFRPLTAKELGEQLQAKLGEGFEVIHTKHYVVCCDAGRPYAKWCAALFERLYAGFNTYWKRRRFKLTEPEFPLAAIVFGTQKQFALFAAEDAGPSVASAKGYYSLKTNRMVLYDLTASNSGRRARSFAEINAKLATSQFNTATIVHEATHQIAFNRGMHVRYADNPLWLTEGMAMFFETPDLKSKTGWRTIGAVNTWRINRFRDFARNRRKNDSLATLISSKARFHDPEQSTDAYAEAWALSYFLIKTKKKEYAEYLKVLSAKPPLYRDTPETRLQQFRDAFGDDFEKLNRDWLRFLQRAARRK